MSYVVYITARLINSQWGIPVQVREKMPRRRAYCDWSNWTRNWTDFNLEYRLLQRLVVNMVKPQALILSGSGSGQHHRPFHSILLQILNVKILEQMWFLEFKVCINHFKTLSLECGLLLNSDPICVISASFYAWSSCWYQIEREYKGHRYVNVPKQDDVF